MTKSAILLFASSFEAEEKSFGLGDHADRLVHQALLRHTINLANRADADLVVAHRGAPQGTDNAQLIFEQRGETFGERIDDAITTAFAAGYDRLVLVGGDTATLTQDDFDAALDAPIGDVVIGPSTDGGFYLLTVDRDCAWALRDLPWQTARIFDELVTRLQFHGAQVRQLPCRADVDGLRDVCRQLSTLAYLVRVTLGVALDNFPVLRATPARPLLRARAGTQQNTRPRGPPKLSMFAG